MGCNHVYEGLSRVRFFEECMFPLIEQIRGSLRASLKGMAHLVCIGWNLGC